MTKSSNIPSPLLLSLIKKSAMFCISKVLEQEDLKPGVSVYQSSHISTKNRVVNILH